MYIVCVVCGECVCVYMYVLCEGVFVCRVYVVCGEALCEHVGVCGCICMFVYT